MVGGRCGVGCEDGQGKVGGNGPWSFNFSSLHHNKLQLCLCYELASILISSAQLDNWTRRSML